MAALDLPVIFCAFGSAIEVVFPDASFYQAFKDTLAPYWSSNEKKSACMSLLIKENERITEINQTYALYENGNPRVLNLPADDIRKILSQRLNYYLGEFSNEFAFVHAGVVLWHQKAIILPGPSHAGKTTLTAALVDAGADYVCDDVAVIGYDGHIRLLSHPIRLRPDVAPNFTLPASATNPEHYAFGSATVSGILFLHFYPDRPIALKPLSKGEATINLLANCLNARQQPLISMNYCAKATEAAWCIKGFRGEATLTAEHILSQLDTIRRY